MQGPKIGDKQYLGYIGLPGSDKGKGGKYQIVPADYKGKVDAKLVAAGMRALSRTPRRANASTSGVAGGVPHG